MITLLETLRVPCRVPGVGVMGELLYAEGDWGACYAFRTHALLLARTPLAMTEVLVVLEDDVPTALLTAYGPAPLNGVWTPIVMQGASAFRVGRVHVPYMLPWFCRDALDGLLAELYPDDTFTVAGDG